MKRLFGYFAVVLGLLATSAAADPIPVPYRWYTSIQRPDFSTDWFFNAALINYTVDLVALFVALWLMRRTVRVSKWRVPLYNLIVFAAGYLSDLLAMLLWIPYVTLSGPLVAIEFMALAAVLIFVSNLVIIGAIVRWNGGTSFSEVPLAAGVIAVLTSPYGALLGTQSPLPFLVPLILLAAGGLVYLAIRAALGQRRKPTDSG